MFRFYSKNRGKDMYLFRKEQTFRKKKCQMILLMRFFNTNNKVFGQMDLLLTKKGGRLCVFHLIIYNISLLFISE